MNQCPVLTTASGNDDFEQAGALFRWMSDGQKAQPVQPLSNPVQTATADIP